jgi:hypothetical protein
MSSIACGSSADRTAPSVTTRPVVWSSTGRLARACRPRKQIASIVAIGVLASALLAACGGSGVHAQGDPTPSVSITTPSSVATPKAPSKSAQAVAAAVVQVKKYERLLGEFAIHPGMSLDRLYSVSTQPDVTDEIAFLNHFRSSGDRQHGLTRVVSAKVISVELAGQGPARSPRPTVQLKVCLDVSGVHAFGREGKSIVPASRKPFYLAHLRLVKVRYQKRPTWLVANVAATEERSCDD